MEKRTLFGGSGTLQKTILVSYKFKQLTIVFSKLSPTGQLPESWLKTSYIASFNDSSEKLCSAQPGPCTQQPVIPLKADTEPREANTHERLLERGQQFRARRLVLVCSVPSGGAAVELIGCSQRALKTQTGSSVLLGHRWRNILIFSHRGSNFLWILREIFARQSLRFEPSAQPQRETLFSHSLHR